MVPLGPEVKTIVIKYFLYETIPTANKSSAISLIHNLDSSVKDVRKEGKEMHWILTDRSRVQIHNST